ncbi:MFS transporter [Rhodococcus sp. ABRD24]|uniref:MFS transporter n=1 Tax=Rhodococcus sp. ABRD24 TaxID=2507582 RepID=UPI00103A1911|nr:MFS transporter [Rhodococcus sp. ABRD24]QBJ98079.1 MFS transporter [Rhodococcus sp. ABRD24]
MSQSRSASQNSWPLEGRTVLIFFLTWGLVFLDRQALSILMPLIDDDINLTKSQVGQINMWQTIGYALSAPIFAFAADRFGRRKPILLFGILATAVLTAVTMSANSFGALLIVRSLLGASEGIILPIAIAIVASTSAPQRFGRNVGFVYAGAAVIAASLGPVVVTQIAEMSTWKMTFVMISVPTFVAALLVWAFIEEPAPTVDAAPVGERTGASDRAALLAGLANRNILVCVAISIFAMGGLWTFNSFLPLYLTEVSELPIATMGVVMSLFGVVSILWQVFLPYSSDRIGRKPAMIGYALLAALTPAMLLLFPQSGLSLVVYVAIGGVIMTMTALFVSIIPVESVPVGIMATAGALIMGIGELLGSFAVGGAGALADRYGLSVVMLVAAISYVVVAVVSIALVETRSARRSPKADESAAEQLPV